MPGSPSRRVLVVEDDFYVAMSLAKSLEGEGVEVLGPVSGVSEALEIITGDVHIDGAILDINLGGEMAYPVADVLRECGVRYVYTTGYDAGAIARLEPDVPCFEKPSNAAELLAVLFGCDRE